jgi:polygalacturonase
MIRLVLVALLVASLGFSPIAQAQGYTLTINTFGSGSVTTSPPGPYAANTLVTLTVTPAAGWSFSSWSGDLTGYARPASLIVNADSTVTATFDQNGYRGVTGDPRTLTEPTFPPVCTVLLAQQSSINVDQTLFDTTTLQAAVEACPLGQAVELASSGDFDAFLIQPIVLKAGVALLIDADVTLFGSSDRGDYSCGSSCRPLIQIAPNAAPNPPSAIMGYGIIDGQGGFFWGTSPRPRLISLGNPSAHLSSDNFSLYKATIQNAPEFAVSGMSNGLVVWGVKIRNPGNAPNTDGIDPSASTNVTIRDSYISTGDDHVAIKAGQGHVANVTITHNHLYYGHGMSIGSETNAGADNVLVTDNVIDQAGCATCTSSNNLRIKSNSSRGGEVQNILYQDTCLRNANTRTHELVFDPFYSGPTGTLIPNFHNIAFHNIHMLDAGGVSTLKGYDREHVLTMSMDNVVFDGYNANDFSTGNTSHAAFALGPSPVSFAPVLIARQPTYDDVSVTNNISNSDPPYDCSGRFIYLAGELFASSVDPRGSVTLTSVLQPAIWEDPDPTGTVSFWEGSTRVASAGIGGRLVSATVPGVSPGTHVYTASYSGDGNYAPLNYGSVTITSPGSVGAARARVKPLSHGSSRIPPQRQLNVRSALHVVPRLPGDRPRLTGVAEVQAVRDGP